MREWVLELPFTRPLSLNGRGNYYTRARQIKAFRNAGWGLAMQAKIPPLSRIAVELHYAPRDGRRRDSLNLVATLKPIEDGIVDAGVIVDDTPAYSEPTMPVIDPPIGGKTGRLYVIVRELPSAASGPVKKHETRK